jgi:hypothetical protein
MAQGSVRIWAVAALIGLGACTAPAEQSAPSAAVAAAPSAPAPPLAASPPASRPRPADSCGAAALQYLVGKPRTDIPVPVNPSMRRVVCSSCMITQDYIAGRQTITYDTQTGLVSSVRCG